MDLQAVLVFEGVDGRECERFIRTVRSRAFSLGKQRDQEWMADFASTCFEGRALRWFSGLDEETRGNWRLLEQALLRDFPTADGGVAPSSSTIPSAPAAAPPPPRYEPEVAAAPPPQPRSIHQEQAPW
ncbi:hypothetical protein FRB90_004713, partial [Tulasnella sp. 427]